MNSLGPFVKRFWRASMPEKVFRARQVAFGSLNRIGAWAGSSALSARGFHESLGCEVDRLPDWWSSRPSKWFLDDRRVQILKDRRGRPESLIESVIERADRVCEGTMPLFSQGFLEFSGCDRWHTDPVLGRIAPRAFYADVPFLDSHIVGDAKLVWEPNRFQWALWLGLAYVITEEVGYAETFLELTGDWFDQNPYPIGINFASALEVGLRLYSWIWCLHLFESCWEGSPEILHRLLQGIWSAARHVENNLSYYFSPNTHLTGEAFALFACGAALPELSESTRWRRLGQQILSDEASRQFCRDGTHREFSSGYHLYSTDFYLQAVLIAGETGIELNPEIRVAAERSSERLAQLVPRGLVLPRFNDCDGGRLTYLCQESLDAAPTLFAAASLFDRIDIPAGNREPCGYCLLMTPVDDLESDTTPEVRHSSPADPSGRSSSQLPDSGIVAYRNAGGDYLLFRASPFGYGDSPHSHDASLSLILMLADHPIFVDAGVGSYTRSLSMRNTFRSASASNSLAVDGHGSSIPGGWFDWMFTTNSVLQVARGVGCGYVCAGSCTISRSDRSAFVSLHRTVWIIDEGSVVIEDEWKSDIEVAPQAFFTLDPDCVVDTEEEVLRLPGGLEIHYGSDSMNSSGQSRLQVIPVPFSPAYGEVTTSRALVWNASRCAHGKWTTYLSKIGPIDSVFRERMTTLLETCAESVAT